jgi:hypothetical protein
VKPDIRPDRHCFRPYDCEFWQRCISDKPKDWVFYIPRVSSANFDTLESGGVVSMRDVPKDFPLKPQQRRVIDAAKSGKVYRSPELAKFLPLLEPPASYLDVPIKLKQAVQLQREADGRGWRRLA